MSRTLELELDVAGRGQVFTPNFIVARMLGLRENEGRVLEPSCGDGAFLSHLESGAVGIELDNRFVLDSRVWGGDFFAYSRAERFDTIIGNPPYVRYRDIGDGTKELLPSGFDRRSNLYLFFIDKCIDHLNLHGELIFITPRDFMKATSARDLNRRLYEEGSMTHFYDLGDANIFAGAAPNCAIWRWVKGRTDRRTYTGGDFMYRNGLLWFGDASDVVLGDYFDIRVGAVSGADWIFSDVERGCTEFVCSRTASDGSKRRMIYNRHDDSLEAFKPELLNRRIRKFDESNWWSWGRKYHEKEGERIYVNCKTRRSNPFFVSDVEAYDGSVLALFARDISMNLGRAVDKLNGIDWERLGFVCDGRLLFTQRSLANIPVDLAL